MSAYSHSFLFVSVNTLRTIMQTKHVHYGHKEKIRLTNMDLSGPVDFRDSSIQCKNKKEKKIEGFMEHSSLILPHTLLDFNFCKLISCHFPGWLSANALF